MNIYEVTIGIGETIAFYHANSEEEVIEFVKREYPNLRRYNKLTDEEKRESCLTTKFMDTYHVCLLHSDAINHRINNYKTWISRMEADISGAKVFLGQLLQN